MTMDTDDDGPAAPPPHLSHNWMVEIQHPDGSRCFHTGITQTEVQQYAADNSTVDDTVTYFTRDAFTSIHGVHWIRAA